MCQYAFVELEHGVELVHRVVEVVKGVSIRAGAQGAGRCRKLRVQHRDRVPLDLNARKRPAGELDDGVVSIADSTSANSTMP